MISLIMFVAGILLLGILVVFSMFSENKTYEAQINKLTSNLVDYVTKKKA